MTEYIKFGLAKELSGILVVFGLFAAIFAFSFAWYLRDCIRNSWRKRR